MGAIIVQCPSCQARFHLAQERIPEKGARVRCSRCEHRFYVTSTGDVSESKPRRTKSDGESGPQTNASSGSSSGSQSASSLELSSSGSSSQPPRKRAASREAATTAMDAMREPAAAAPRIRALGSPGPQEDADLDDPQFLFDDTQSSPELPYTPGNFGSEAEEEPSSEAFGEAPGRPRAARSPDTDVTPHAPPEPEAPEPGSPSSASGEGSWLSNDDEAIPDIRAQRDELALQSSRSALSAPDEGFDVTGSETPERAVEPPPEPAAHRAPRVEAPRPAARAAAAPDAVPGRYAGAGSAVLVARSVPERAAREAAAPVPAGPLCASLERASTLVSVLTALALLFAGWNVLYAQLGEPAGPERIHVEGGEISSVEVLHLRDAEGRRVLAVRGLLQSSGAERPRVLLRLLDPLGNTLGAPYPARPGFLRDAELGGERLAELLTPDHVPSLASGDVRGFTVLVRDPPFEAERFALELAG